jgi:hypothetical protein
MTRRVTTTVELARKPLHDALVDEWRNAQLAVIADCHPRHWAPWCGLVAAAAVAAVVLPSIPVSETMPAALLYVAASIIGLVGLGGVAFAFGQVWVDHRRGRRCNQARALLSVSHMFAPMTSTLSVASATPVFGLWLGAVVTCRSGAQWPVKCQTRNPIELVTRTVEVAREHWEKCEGCRVGR